ncbi:MAG: aminotransferase class V-fold PLP-dependent enzyme [Bacilli bacterium]
MVYLDNAASSWPKPPGVPTAIADWVANNGANPGRASHTMARSAERMIMDARTEMAHFLGLVDPHRVIFLQSITEALNLALQGLLQSGDHVVGAGFEHNSVRRPLERMRSRGVSVDYVSCHPDDWILRVLAACTAKTRLVVATHGSNVHGEVLPVEELAAALQGIRDRNGNPLLLVDAAQTAGLVPLSLHAGHIDLLAFSGHKALYGPQGTGGLCIASEISLEPLLLGGAGADSLSASAPQFGPERYEAGTRNTPGIAGLLADLRFVKQQTPAALLAHGAALTARLIEELRNIPAINVVDAARASPRLPVVSFQLNGYQPAELAHFLDEHYDIAVRAGLHCSPHAHRQLGTVQRNGTVRVSIGCFNTPHDIDCLLGALRELASDRK